MANPRAASDPQKLVKRPEYITIPQIAAMLDVSQRTLTTWKTRGYYPLPEPSHKVVASHMYDIREIYLWAIAEEGRNNPIVPREGVDKANASYETIRSANKEKARLDKARADNQEIKNRILISEYVPIDIVADLLAKFSALVSAALGSIPGTLKKKYSWLKAAQIEDIQTTITRVQHDIAGVKIEIAAPTGVLDDGEDTGRAE